MHIVPRRPHTRAWLCGAVQVHRHHKMRMLRSVRERQHLVHRRDARVGRRHGAR